MNTVWQRRRWWLMVALAMLLACGHETTRREVGIDREDKVEVPGQRKGGSGEETAPVGRLAEAMPTQEMKSEVGGEVEDLAGPAFESTDELWVVVRELSRERQKAASAHDALGAVAKLAAPESPGVPTPVSIRVSITGSVATVDHVHTLVNPSGQPADLMYEFTLPSDAGLREFLVTIGDRRIRGIIRERHEAATIYQMARRRGLMASLVELDSSRVVRHRVANIAPGKQVDVTFTYCHALPYLDGAYELRVPVRIDASMTSSGGISTAADPGGSAESSQGANGIGPSTPVTIEVSLDAGIPIESVTSPTHRVVVERPHATTAYVRMAQPARTSEGDFVLRYAVAGPDVRAALFTSLGPGGDTYFNLLVVPPVTAAAGRRVALELIAVVDCSKAMMGANLALAKALTALVISQLTPQDAFLIIPSPGASGSGEAPVPATATNVAAAIDAMPSAGEERPTELSAGLQAACAIRHDSARLPVLLIMSDGRSMEPAALDRALEHDQAARVFCVGIGEEVDGYVLERLTAARRGGVLSVRSGDKLAAVAEEFMQQIAHPVLTDLRMEWGSLRPSILPGLIPDFFPGRPIMIAGRCASTPSGPLRILGVEGSTRRELTVTASESDNPGIASVWAHRELARLVWEALCDPSGRSDLKVRQHALEYGLLSPQTSFALVDTKSGP